MVPKCLGDAISFQAVDFFQKNISFYCNRKINRFLNTVVQLDKGDSWRKYGHGYYSDVVRMTEKLVELKRGEAFFQ